VDRDKKLHFLFTVVYGNTRLISPENNSRQLTRSNVLQSDQTTNIERKIILPARKKTILSWKSGGHLVHYLHIETERAISFNFITPEFGQYYYSCRTARVASILISQPIRLINHWGSVSLPEVVPFAEYQVGFGVQRGSDFTQPTVAAAAFETVLVPEQVQSFEQEPFGYAFAAIGALPGYHRRAAVQTS